MTTAKLRVLLADDHAIIRDGLKQILADTLDLAVAGEAANGQEVMQMVRQGVWDVLVLDISMPDQGGVEALKSIRERSLATSWRPSALVCCRRRLPCRSMARSRT